MDEKLKKNKCVFQSLQMILEATTESPKVEWVLVN